MNMEKNKEYYNNNLSINAQKTSVTRVHFSGPLPDPMVLDQYEKILPGSADRIIKLAEKQSEHRIEIEKKVINSNIKKSEKGLLYGLVIGIATLISATLIGIFGKNTASYILSGIIGAGGLGSLVTVFIYSKNETRKERATRREETFIAKKNGN